MKNLNKSFILINLAKIISVIGDSIFDIVLLIYVASLSRDVLGITTASFTYLLITSISSIFIGIIIDIFPKKNVMIVSAFGSTLLMLILILLNIENSSSSIVKVAIILGIFIGVNNIFNNAFKQSIYIYNSLTLHEDKFVKYQTMINMIVRVVYIISISISGIIFQYVPLNTVLLFNLSTFFLSGIIILFVRKTNEEYNAHSKAKRTTKLLEIPKLLVTDRGIFFFTLILCILNLSYAIIPEILPLSIMNYYDFSPNFFSLIKGLLIVAELIAFSFIIKKAFSYSTYVIVGLCISIGSLLLVSVSTSSYLIIIWFFIYGVADGLTQPLYNIFISDISRNVRATVLGVINLIVLLVAGLGIIFYNYLYNTSFKISVSYLTIPLLLGLVIYIFYDKGRLSNWQKDELEYLENSGAKVKKSIFSIQVSKQDIEYKYFYNNKSQDKNFTTKRLSPIPKDNYECNFLYKNEVENDIELQDSYSFDGIEIRKSDQISENYFKYKIIYLNQIVGEVSLVHAHNTVGIYDFIIDIEFSEKDIDTKTIKLIINNIESDLFVQTCIVDSVSYNLYLKLGFEVMGYYNYI